MKSTRSLAPLALALTVAALPIRAAHADDAGLYHARAGLMLESADQAVRLFFTALSAKDLDLELSKTALADAKRALAEAKSSLFRASQLVEAKGAEGDFKKAEEQLSRALESLSKLEGDFKDETANMKLDDENGESTKDDEEGGKQPDWDLLRGDTSQLHADVAQARGLHGKLSKAAKASPLKAPPPPKKK